MRTLASIALLTLAAAAAAEDLDYRIELTSPTKLFDGTQSWAHPRAGAIPPRTPGNPSDTPLVVMTMQTVQLVGSDLFSGLHEMRTADMGRTWTAPAELPTFKRRPFEGNDNWLITVCDFNPKWHAATGKLLGTGHTVVYEGDRIPKVRPRAAAYAVYDAETKQWAPWKTIELPGDPKFANAGAGCTQRVDLPNGDILLPIYFAKIGDKQYSAAVARCRFDGTTLRYIEHGNEMTVPVDRGFVEPSLTEYRGRFYLTLRNDRAAYVATSTDGLRFDEPRKWTFDDGSELGSYNTQAHWVTHSDGLFLSYTRRGAGNDHVFRHRAPLFIARVNPDPANLHVIRATERELMPNRGARLGNFYVTQVTPTETWVTDAEWMQPKGVEQYGSDGSVWVTKIHWSKPNAAMR